MSCLEEGRLCVGGVRVVGGIDERPPEAVRDHRLLQGSEELLHAAGKLIDATLNKYQQNSAVVKFYLSA